MNIQLCVLCGKNAATTREHVPPRAIFPKPRPSNLITVPACFDCNNQSSQSDESFMVHLGMHVGSEGTSGGRVLTESAIPALKHNSKLRNWIIENIRPAKVLCENNDIIGEVEVGLWDSDAHSKTIEKCIRGLYFYHYGKILESQTTIKTQYFNMLHPELIKISNEWANYSVGNGDFVYKFSSASNETTHMSIWIFQFFNRHWAGGQTTTDLQVKNV